MVFLLLVARWVTEPFAPGTEELPLKLADADNFGRRHRVAIKRSERLFKSDQDVIRLGDELAIDGDGWQHT